MIRRLLPLLLLFLLPACEKLQRQETENASPSPSPAARAQVSAVPAETGTAGIAATAGGPRERITVHYHRPDGDYTISNLWTWDTYQKHTPAGNDLAPVGQDDFGAVFQLDRTKYGNSDKIGLLPRLGHDWGHKDGTDRTWVPRFGDEVWILSGKPGLLMRRPDLAPRLEAAYADKAVLIDLRLSQPVDASQLQAGRIRIGNELRQAVPITQAIPIRIDGSTREIVSAPGKATDVEVTCAASLDVSNHRYAVAIDGLGKPVLVMPRGLLDDPTLYYSPNAVLGATYSAAATTFRVFAPTPEAMSVIIYDDAMSGKGRTMIPMRAAPKGIWETTVGQDLAGKYYLLLPQGADFSGQEIVDPYATNTVNSTSRARITPQGPPPLPLAARSTSWTDRIIYEMHVRDFTISPSSGISSGGLYGSWTVANARLPQDARIKTGIDHLAELGVTDVQIMPVQDFANDEYARQYNWGYITSAFFSPEGMYATNPADDSRVRELKGLIGALHQRGIGVIMDVVYNHTSDTSPFLSLAPTYYYRLLPDGTFSNGSGCGNEFKTEAPMARKYLIESLKYWAREYNVDGFRFDLMALLDQETMREAERALHAINPAIALYGEPWTGGDSILQSRTDKTALRQVPVGAFNDDFRNALKGSPDGSDPGFIQDGSNREALKKAMLVSEWFDAPWQSINYMTCHDNLVLWDKLKGSMPSATDGTIKAAARLGYLVLLTSPGVPFFQGGEEFGRSKGGNNNSFDSPDSVNEVDWSLKKTNYDLFTYVRDLIALRKAHPLFRLRTRAEVAARLKFLPVGNDQALAYEINSYSTPGETWRKALVIVNPDAGEPLEIALPDGEWEVACDAKGASMGHAMSGKITVAEKSGMVLFQE